MRFTGFSFIGVAAYGLIGMASATASGLPADPLLGFWATENREATIELYACDDRVCGRFRWMRDDSPKHVMRDGNNRDEDKRHHPLCHMQFIGGFMPDGPEHYSDGWIYNPDDGSTYDGAITLIDHDTLKISGYLWLPLLGQSQIWTRAKSEPSCATEHA